MVNLFYLDKNPKLNQFYNHFPELSNFSSQIQEKSKTLDSLEFDRSLLSETLSKRSLGTGPDQVPGDIIRAISNNLSVHFLKLLQHIISTCEYPECWKLIDIKPIQKSQYKDIENYRPVVRLSKLPLYWKITVFEVVSNCGI